MISNDIRDFDELLDAKYGKRGTTHRENWENEFESFKIGVLIEEARKKKNMTQEELALKCGTNTSYISRIENDSSDIKLSTLMRIVKDGLGGNLKVSLDI